MKYYITGTRRGLGYALEQKYSNCGNLKNCDVFINCKHNGFSQVDLLYNAAELNKKIINIGSAASDWTKGYKENFKYGIEKKTLREVNEQLFWQGVDTCIINYGFFDTPRSDHVDTKKMSVEYCVSVIEWILQQPHRIKEITVTP
mgnify:CR=1 FL=1|tara:strand:+ start:5462 stop:5896 length:435 start_codon:yes stop_codon:yes gene_type:complete